MKTAANLMVLVSLTIWGRTAIAQQADYICRPNRGTIPCTTGPVDPAPSGSSGGCETFGDPVTLGSLQSTHDVTDFVIDTPVGPFEFKRHFYSSHRAWYSAFGPNLNVRPPFGGGTEPRWWHEVFSVIGQPALPTEGGLYLPDGGEHPSTAGVVRYMDGQSATYHEFMNDIGDACRPPAQCWWPRRYVGDQLQLQSTDAGYRVVAPDGTERFHEAVFAFATSAGGANPLSKRYLLSRIQAPSGATLASIHYSAPVVSGGSCIYTLPAHSYVGVSPYISLIELAGGHLLKLNYEKPDVSVAECRLKSVDYLAPGSASPIRMVTYAYDSAGVWIGC